MKSYMLKLFTRKHYSTAEKCMKSIEEKIIDALNSDPEFNSLCQKNGVEDGSPISITGISKLAETLGDILNNCLSEKLYETYQALQDKEKKELREIIVSDYLRVLRSIKEFKNLEIQKITEDHGRWGESVSVEISLPDMFINKTELSKALSESLISVCKRLGETQKSNVAESKKIAL